MAGYRRRGGIGLLAGLASTVLLATTLPNGGAGIVFGLLVGVGYALAFAPTPRAYVDQAMTAASLGLPLTRGGMPALGRLEAACAQFPALVAYVLGFGMPLGAALGIWGSLQPQPGHGRVSAPVP